MPKIVRQLFFYFWPGLSLIWLENFYCLCTTFHAFLLWSIVTFEGRGYRGRYSNRHLLPEWCRKLGWYKNLFYFERQSKVKFFRLAENALSKGHPPLIPDYKCTNKCKLLGKIFRKNNLEICIRRFLNPL